MKEVSLTEAADLMMQRAMLLQREDRIPESIDAYQKVLERWPGRADGWFNLAYLHRRAMRLDLALFCYQKALDAGVSRPEEAHLNRSVIYSDHLHQPAAAERELELALQLNPSFVPALLNHAALCEDLGRRADAEGIYSKILTLDAGCSEALARYANLLPIDAAQTLVPRLRGALADPALSPADRASLGFALGRILDGAGEHARAFAAYRDANRASRDSAAPYVPPYDPVAESTFIDRLIAAAATEGAAAPSPATASPRPVFICGMFRSGSTLTEQLLANCPGVAAGGELDFLPRLVAGELAPYPESLATLSADRIADFAARYSAELRRVSGAAMQITDKRPDNFFHIGLIKRLFPDARIVHTIRNPLDNCLSIYFLHLDQRMSYALDLGAIGHHYREYRRLMSHWKSLYPLDIFDVDYDVLVRDPQRVLRPLVAFLGIECDGDVPLVPPADRAVKTASVWQVREPLYRRSSGRARHYLTELEPLRAALADLP